MRVLVTGKGGGSGSWAIRGVQLGNAIDARVKPMASLADMTEADIVVVVKRVPAALLQNLRSSGRPWVYDIVDGWPQPCDWSEAASITWLYNTLGHLRPTAIVCGTKTMQEDAAFMGPSLVLPHHSWDRYVEAPIPDRPDSTVVVGYEGSEQHLGKWKSVIIEECARRGWRFEINGNMLACDIGIALRDGGGYPAKNWKPGTKLSNLAALNIPAVCSVERGYVEQSTGHELWVEDETDLRKAFNRLEDCRVRRKLGEKMADGVIHLSNMARTYLEFLHHVR